MLQIILLYTVMTTNMNNGTHLNIKPVLKFSSKCTIVHIFRSLNY